MSRLHGSVPNRPGRRAAAAIISLLALCGTLPDAHSQPLCPLDSPDRTRYDGQMLVRVTLRGAHDLLLINQLALDCWSHSAGPAQGSDWGTLDYRVDAPQLRALRGAGMACEILIPDLQSVIDDEARRLSGPAPRGWFDDFKNADQISDYTNQLVALRPDIARRQTIGSSLQNREIYALRLSGLPAQQGAVKPILLLNSVQHAREWLSVMTTMYIADQLVNGYGTESRATNLLDTYEVVIIPVVNADGYSYTWTNDRYWRKNRRANAGGGFGVDLNRNWSFAWGSDNGSSGSGSSDTYRGTAPFSEPETAAMRDWTLANPGIVMHLDVHTYGPLLLYSWGYTASPAPGAGALNRLGLGMRQAILSSGGISYTTGQCYTTLYPVSGGSIDWYYGDRNTLSWTPELRGPGFAPPPSTILPTGKEIYAAILWLGENYCPADVDRTGFVDTDDFDTFVVAFEAGAPAADFDHTGFVDTEDFDAFVRAFEIGC